MNLKQSNRKFMEMMKHDKHFQHAFLDSHRIISMGKRGSFDLWLLPVCAHCECVGYWHMEDGVPMCVCPNCEHVTKNPITYEQYKTQGLDVDRIVHPGAPRVVDRQLTTAPTATVYGGEAGLPDKDKAHVVIEPPKPL